MTLLLVVAWVTFAAWAEPEPAWNTSETPHFAIHHERAAFSLGDHNRLERIYEALHPDLQSLVSGLSEEKTQVYLYKDAESYLSGRFKPPRWSAGLFQLSESEKALAVFEPVDTAVAAHELTHLYLHSYFGDQQARLPPWLDEGLAGMLENEALSMPDPRDKGPVLRSVAPLDRFFRSRPDKDAPQGWVSGWYQQAHSVVRFLKRGHIEASFADFCASLKSGKSAEAALGKVYGYSDLAAFDAAWNRWRPRKAMGLPVGLEDK